MSSRLPCRMSPSRSSLLPYESAVSKSVMPSSRAACTTARLCSRSSFMPKLFVPRPTTDTTRPELPRRRNSILRPYPDPVLTYEWRDLPVSGAKYRATHAENAPLTAAGGRPSEGLDDVLDAVLGIAEEHGAVVAEEQRVLHPGVARGHRALEDDDVLRLP